MVFFYAVNRGNRNIHPKADDTINRTRKVKVPESHKRFELTSSAERPKPSRTNPTQINKLDNIITNHHSVDTASLRKTNTAPVRKPEKRPNITLV